MAQDIRAPRRRKADLLGEIPDGQLICRAMHRHDFPSDRLDPRMRKLPKGMTAQLTREGVFQITDTCQRCGKIRAFTMQPGALFDTGTVYSYAGQTAPGFDDWVTVPWDDASDLGITSRDYRGEQFRRSAEMVIRDARPAKSTS